MKDGYTVAELKAIDWFKNVVNTEDECVITKLDTLVNIEDNVPVPEHLRGVFTYENTYKWIHGSKETGVDVSTAIAVSYGNKEDVSKRGQSANIGVCLYTDVPVPRTIVHPKFLLNNGIMDNKHPRNIVIRTITGSNDEANGDWLEIHSIGHETDDDPTTACIAYEIKLNRIATEGSLVRWLYHLLRKQWFTPYLATGFIEAVCKYRGWPVHGSE